MNKIKIRIDEIRKQVNRHILAKIMISICLTLAIIIYPLNIGYSLAFLGGGLAFSVMEINVLEKELKING